MATRRIAINCGGGYVPGLNAVDCRRGAVRRAELGLGGRRHSRWLRRTARARKLS